MSMVKWKEDEISKGGRPPRTTLAAIESLAMPLVQEVVFLADFRCARCQQRVADILSKMNGVRVLVFVQVGVRVGFCSMAQDLEARLSKFSLSEGEKNIIQIHNNDINTSVEECSRSLFGKICGGKKANFGGLKRTFFQIWPAKEAFAIREIGFNYFQFIFDSMEDKNRIFGKNWTFDNHYLVLREWAEGISEFDVAFQRLDLWIQVWNIPNSWLSSEVGIKIGKAFCKLKDVVIPEGGSLKGIHMKLLVDVDLSKPLLRGTRIMLGEKIVWVDFRYEQLINICFYCGKIGHLDRACDQRKQDIENETLHDGQYGEWLKAETPQSQGRDDSSMASKTNSTSSNTSIEIPSKTIVIPHNPDIPIILPEPSYPISPAQPSISQKTIRPILVLKPPTLKPKEITIQTLEPSHILTVHHAASTSKSLIVPTQPTIEMPESRNPQKPVTEPTPGLDQSKLINIPVLANLNRIPLNNISSSINIDTGNPNCIKPKGKKRVLKGKSKLTEKSELVNMDISDDFSSLKRGRELCENKENEYSHGKPEGHEEKKQKLSDSQELQVEEASLDWPQSYQ